VTDTGNHTLLDVRGLWKAYPRWPSETRTLKEAIRQRAPFAMRRAEKRWALRDVSLALGAGEAVGIIGANGAGKSTLLRLAAGLGQPTRGERRATEDLAAVLSLGATFDLTLTGSENAITLARVLGLSGAEARDALPAILEFAELEEFGGAPVRTYSEGMKLRLAFGVVAQLRPRLLVVDEVLAVGDLRFQDKCLTRIRELRDAGTALLFASHDLEQVAAHCDRALWLDEGGVRGDGAAEAVLAAYRDAMHEQTLARTPTGAPDELGLELGRNRFGSQEMRITAVRICDARGRAADEIESGTSFSVELDVDRRGLEERPIVSVAVARPSDHVELVDVNSERALLSSPAGGPLTIRAEFPPLEVVPGRYRVSVGIYPPGWGHAYDYHWEAYPLRVTGAGAAGVLNVAPRWSLKQRQAPRE